MTEYRGYNITNDNNYMMKKIEAIGRGSVHLSLRGLYTTEVFAKRDIDIYENALIEKEEVKSGKIVIRRRS